MNDIATMTDSTMEVVETVYPNGSVADRQYSLQDIYYLAVAMFILLFALLMKNTFRKMYINLRGGRKED